MLNLLCLVINLTLVKMEHSMWQNEMRNWKEENKIVLLSYRPEIPTSE